MAALAVHGVLERLGDVAVLHGETGVAVAADALVHRPRRAQVVKHHVVAVVDGDGVVFLVVIETSRFTHTHADEAHDDVAAALDNQRIVRQTDTVTRSCLTCYGEVVALHFKLFFQNQVACNIEHYSQRFIHCDRLAVNLLLTDILCECPSKRTFYWCL